MRDPKVKRGQAYGGRSAGALPNLSMPPAHLDVFRCLARFAVWLCNRRRDDINMTPDGKPVIKANVDVSFRLIATNDQGRSGRRWRRHLGQGRGVAGQTRRCTRASCFASLA